MCLTFELFIDIIYLFYCLLLNTLSHHMSDEFVIFNFHIHPYNNVVQLFASSLFLTYIQCIDI